MNAFPRSLPHPAQILSKEAINDLPILSYEGDLLLVQTPGELSEALAELRGERILGFDTESRPSFKKGRVYPTALVQLAGERLVVLVRISVLPFDESLARLLADPDIVKAGVAIREDMRSLRKLHDFTPAGLVDLADMAKRQGIQAQGLRTLAAALMGGRISKAAQTLTPQQIRYAATDAWIGRELYLRLKENELYLHH